MSSNLPTTAFARAAGKKVTFDEPLPEPNVSHLIDIVLTGTVEGGNPACHVKGLIQDHEVRPDFVVEMDGVFKVGIAAGLLSDDNLYVVSVWSDDPDAKGAVFIDTRPPG